MAPMANPAITPRGTSYDREALSEWISKEHRYPGGEVRAAHNKRSHTPHSRATHGARLADPPLPPPYAQGPGTLQLDQIAPNYALRMLMEAWIAALAATGATVPATRHA